MTATEVLDNIYDIFITDKRSEYDDAPKINPIDFPVVEDYVKDFREFTEFCLNEDESDFVNSVFADLVDNEEDFEKLKAWGYGLADGQTSEEFTEHFEPLCDKLRSHWEEDLFGKDRYAVSVKTDNYAYHSTTDLEKITYVKLQKYYADEKKIKYFEIIRDDLASQNLDLSSMDNLFDDVLDNMPLPDTETSQGWRGKKSFKACIYNCYKESEMGTEWFANDCKSYFVKTLQQMDNLNLTDNEKIIDYLRYNVFSYKKENRIENKNNQTFAKTRDRIIIDTETTGFSREKDEILQLSIVDADSKEVLFDEYFKPEYKQSWEKAQAVNNISPEMVADKPSIFDRLDNVQKIIGSAETVIVYNSAFDVDFLEHYGVDFSTNVIDDPMCYGAVIYGEAKVRENLNGDPEVSYKWKKLGVLAEHLGYDGNGWHNSTADCIATAYVYEKCREPENLQKFWQNALTHTDYLPDERYIPSELREDYKIIAEHKEKTMNAFVTSLVKTSINDLQRNKLTKSAKEENAKANEGVSL